MEAVLGRFGRKIEINQIITQINIIVSLDNGYKRKISDDRRINDGGLHLIWGDGRIGKVFLKQCK